MLIVRYIGLILPPTGSPLCSGDLVTSYGVFGAASSITLTFLAVRLFAAKRMMLSSLPKPVGRLPIVNATYVIVASDVNESAGRVCCNATCNSVRLMGLRRMT